jgi:ubiquinone/menaquinone biosynthesis C-methylase UbiE
MPKLDPYSITDQMDSTAISSMTMRLEARGENEFFRQMLNDYLDALEPAKLTRVLEVGCGTGVATRALAQHPSFIGHIFASDLSADLVDVAKKRAIEVGCAEKITFSSGDALKLDGEDKYDAVIAHTVASHVPDYHSFIGSLANSTLDGGTIAVFDGDYASITLGAEDPDDGNALANAIIGGAITNPTIMREMPWMAKSHGLRVKRSFSYLLSEIGQASFFADMFPSLPVLLPKSGIADEAKVKAWVEQQMRYSTEGTFFGAINFYTYLLGKSQ